MNNDHSYETGIGLIMITVFGMIMMIMIFMMFMGIQKQQEDNNFPTPIIDVVLKLSEEQSREVILAGLKTVYGTDIPTTATVSIGGWGVHVKYSEPRIKPRPLPERME